MFSERVWQIDPIINLSYVQWTLYCAKTYENKTKQQQQQNKHKKKKNVCKLWALLKISKLRKRTQKELVPLLVLEEQAQVASKRLELITKYRANTLLLLLFSTVSGATIRQNFDFFSFPHSTNPTNHCERPDHSKRGGGGGGEGWGLGDSIVYVSWTTLTASVTSQELRVACAN